MCGGCRQATTNPFCPFPRVVLEFVILREERIPVELRMAQSKYGTLSDYSEPKMSLPWPNTTQC